MHRHLSLFTLCLLLFIGYSQLCCHATARAARSSSEGPVRKVPATGSSESVSMQTGCEDYPTIAKIDCSAFPKGPGKSPRTSGRTLYVSLSGNKGNPGTKPKPLRSIAEALARAKPGDTIVVGGGTYREGLEGDHRSLPIEKGSIHLRAAVGERVTVMPASPAFTYGISIHASDVIIDGIDLAGFSSALITLNSGIKNIVLKNMKVSGQCTDFCDGIVAPDEGGMDGLLLRNVRVEGVDLGISCNVGPCRNWWLDRVTVIGRRAGNDTGADGIAAEVRNEEAPERLISSNWLITNADVTGASGDGIDLKAARVAVYNANVHDNARNGVKFWRGGDLVNSQVINHDADAAIVFDRAGLYRILNSLIAYENFGSGSSYTMTVGYDRPEDPIALSIINSVFWNNAGAIFLSPATATTIEHCLLGNTDNDEILVHGETTIVESAPPSQLAKIAKGSGNLAFRLKPAYRHPPTDFTFPASSPLVDAGTRTDAFPKMDLRGNPRVRGKGPDIGPLELY